MSISVSVTHALVIHSFVLGISPLLRIGELPALALETGLILLVGWAFHQVFERSAFVVRERLVPARAGAPS